MRPPRLTADQAVFTYAADHPRMWRSTWRLSSLGLAAIGLLAIAGASMPAARAAGAEGVPAFGHVFVIVGENQGLNRLTPARSPYLTGTIKPRSAFLTRYTGATLGGSLANYLAMVAGRFTRCDVNDDLPSARCSHPWNNLFGQLDRQRLSWREWAESADAACDIFDHGAAWSENIYTAHHQPALYLTRLHGRGYDEAITPAHECRENVLAMGTTAPDDTGAFDAALAAGNVGRFNLIVPNDCEDGHDPCPPTRDGVRQFDDFLRREVPKIEASPAFASNGLIIITYDSGTSAAHPQVLFDALGAQVRPGVYGGTAYNHYSFLRTMEDGYGITAHLGRAAQAQPIAGIWR
jgi:phosphatidylinositol-3-phosphatase